MLVNPTPNSTVRSPEAAHTAPHTSIPKTSDIFEGPRAASPDPDVQLSQQTQRAAAAIDSWMVRAEAFVNRMHAMVVGTADQLTFALNTLLESLRTLVRFGAGRTVAALNVFFGK